jgi:hypothetical protein
MAWYIFSIKSIYSYREDTNYTQPLQQRIALAALRMHTTKKKEELQKRKVPLQQSIP